MYAAIDIGSNSIRLSLYEYSNGDLKKIFNKKETAGLAGYVTREQKLSMNGQNKLLEVLQSFRSILDTMKISNEVAFATASLRNVKNSEDVVNNMKIHTGFDIRVLSGEEEGTYGYIGAFRNARLCSGILVDIGGGSTELVFFKGQKITSVKSLPLGSLNLYKAYVSDILPTHFEIRNIRNAVNGELNKIYHPSLYNTDDVICAIGGTARTLSKMYARRSKQIETSNGSFPYSFLKSEQKLLEDDRSKVVNSILKVSPERIHTIIPGLTVMKTVMKYFKSKTVIVSDYGVREGMLETRIRKEQKYNV